VCGADSTVLCPRCDSIGKVQSKLDYLRSLLNDQVTFKSIYRYAYDFARVNDIEFIVVYEVFVCLCFISKTQQILIKFGVVVCTENCQANLILLCLSPLKLK
jgi:hypothetical protein